MKIFKRVFNRLNFINVEKDQLSIHISYYMKGLVMKRGICFGEETWDIASKKYLSELEYILNQIKRKQDDNNNKKNLWFCIYLSKKRERKNRCI